MRFFRVFLSLILLLAAASAAELKIKVVDPQSAVVAGAQVVLLEKGGTTPIRLDTTSAEGVVLFKDLADATYSIQVLAQGFAPQNEDISSSKSEITLQLRLAPASETVVVSATRTPVPAEIVGSDVSILNNGQLQVMNSVAVNDTLRFLPGAVVNTAGQRGGIASLFVRGGESRYNKVIIDGVPVNDPGGTFDFGVVPTNEIGHLEFLRGAESALYGSDAMTSVVQMWSRNGATQVPELVFGAAGGNFGTANGYASLAGAHGPFDYLVFADQFNTNGQGPNDRYSNGLQGGNLGWAINNHVSLRLRSRHSNSFTGVPSFWDFNGQRLIPPDLDQFARQNNFLAGLELNIAGPSRWQHHFDGFEYHHVRENVDSIMDPGRISPLFGNIDFPFHNLANINRAGFEYQGEYTERSWAQTTFGYYFDDENGFVGDFTVPDHGVHLNHEVFAQQLLILGRLSVTAGARFVHNSGFGNRGIPRIALAYQLLRGGQVFSGTRLRFSYATGIKEPRLEETFAGPPFSIPNLTLKPERNRAFEAGFQQNLFGGNYVLKATYFNNLFQDQIDYATDPTTFIGQYVNVNKSIAHGAEVEFQGKLRSRFSLNGAYTYTSTQILEQPFAFDPLLNAGQPLLRRPKHSGTVLLSYLGRRWGGNLGGTFVGRRPDSDFLGFGVTHAAGYGRVDAGAWYAITRHVTAYANAENLLNKHYEEVAGYPALSINIRAGMRFTFGGE